MDRRLGGVFLKFYLVAYQIDNLGRGAALVGCRNDRQSDGAALFPADESDGLVEWPVYDADGGLIALRNGDDLVVGA